MQLSGLPPQALGRVHHIVDKTARTAHVQVQVRPRAGQQGRQVEPVAGCAIVEVEPDPSRHARIADTFDKGGAPRRAGAIVHLEVGVDVRQPLGHAQDRRNADAAGEQQRAFGGNQCEVILRRADPQHGAFADLVLDRHRPAARPGVAQHRDQVAVRLGGRVAQRVLADQAWADLHIQMGARAKRRQRPLVRAD